MKRVKTLRRQGLHIKGTLGDESLKESTKAKLWKLIQTSKEESESSSRRREMLVLCHKAEDGEKAANIVQTALDIFLQRNKSLILSVASGLNYSVLTFTTSSVPYTITTGRVFNVLTKCLKVPVPSQFPPLMIKTAYRVPACTASFTAPRPRRRGTARSCCMRREGRSTGQLLG